MCIVISLEMGDSVEGNKNDDAGILSAENEESLQIEKPMLGMVFHDKNELQAFYSNYAREEGFDVKTRSSNMWEDGNQQQFLYFSQTKCSRHATEFWWFVSANFAIKVSLSFL